MILPKNKYTFKVNKEFSFGDKGKEIAIEIQGHITIGDGEGNDQYRAVLSRSADPSLTALIVMNSGNGSTKLKYKGQFSEFSVLYAYLQLPHGNSKQDTTPIIILTSYPKPDDGKGKSDQSLLSVSIADCKYKSLVFCKGEFSIAKQYFKLYQPRGAHKPLTSDLVETDFASLDLLCLIGPDKLMYTRQKRTSNWFDSVPKKNCSFKVEVKEITDYNLDVVGPEQKSGNRLLCWIGNRDNTNEWTVGVDTIFSIIGAQDNPFKYTKGIQANINKEMCIKRLYEKTQTTASHYNKYDLEPVQMVLCSKLNLIVVLCLEKFEVIPPIEHSEVEKKYSMAVLVFAPRLVGVNEQASTQVSAPSLESRGKLMDGGKDGQEEFHLSSLSDPSYERLNNPVFEMELVQCASLRKNYIV
jgi:hypothetical protein